MRFAWACLAHALEGRYGTHRNPAVLIPAEAHVADEVWRLQQCRQESDCKPRTRVRIDSAEELMRGYIVHVHIPCGGSRK